MVRTLDEIRAGVPAGSGFTDTSQSTDELAEARRTIDRLTADLNDQEARHADRNAEARQSLEARDRLLLAATTRVRMAAEILGATEVGRARDEIVTRKGAVLADAIRDALGVLDGPPASPAYAA